jgi:hypothetical protein
LDIFKETFQKTKKYPYSNHTLEYLTEKSSLFLLNYFHQIYNNLGKSIPVDTIKTGEKRKMKSKIPKEYQLASLDIKVNVMCLPTGYSTESIPENDVCDYCQKPLNVFEGKALTCGHGYHWKCHVAQKHGCDYCEQFYKKGIFENVSSFLKRLDKGIDELTPEEINDFNSNDPDEENNENEADLNVSDQENLLSTLLEAINEVKNW